MGAIKIGGGDAWTESLLVMGLEVLFIGFRDASNLNPVIKFGLCVHKIAHLDTPAPAG